MSIRARVSGLAGQVLAKQHFTNCMPSLVNAWYRNLQQNAPVINTGLVRNFLVFICCILLKKVIVTGS